MKKLFFMVCCAALLMTGCKDGKNAPGLRVFNRQTR